MQKEPKIKEDENNQFDDAWRERLEQYKKTKEFQKNLEILKKEIDQTLPTEKPEKKLVFVLTGIPGSGKSTLAKIINNKFHPSIILRSDQIFFKKLHEQIKDDYYKAYLYQEELARLYLKEGYSIIMDDNNRTSKNRKAVYKLAQENNAEPISISIKVNLENAQKRVTQKDGKEKSDKQVLRDLKIFANQTKMPTSDELDKIIEIDGNKPLELVKHRLVQELSK